MIGILDPVVSRTMINMSEPGVGRMSGGSRRSPWTRRGGRV